MSTPVLDPRLYGIAPREAEAHDGEVLWTLEGVALYVGCSPDSIRRNPDLMRLRKAIRPRVYRWIPDDVRAYVKALGQPPVSLALVKQLRPDRRAIQQQRKQRRVRREQEREFDAKLGWEPPVLPTRKRR